MKPSNIKESWYRKTKHLFKDERMLMLRDWLIKQKPFSPNFKDVFKCFSLNEFEDVKCVMVGLSPYQGVVDGKKVATGIPFGVIDESHDTPSLRCIRDAISADTGIITVEDYFDWTLESWFEQGVFMFNAAFTVKTGGDARSHLKQWTWFSEGLVQMLNDKFNAMPFVFMGKDAQRLSEFLDSSKNHIIKVHHPAAASYDSDYDMSKQKVFKQVNDIIESVNGSESKIKWLNYNY